MEPADRRILEDYFRFAGVWNCGVFIHASAVRTPRGALVLLGPSNAGKTTLARLLSSEYPIIDEDCMYLYRRRDGEFRACSGQIHHSILQTAGRMTHVPWHEPLSSEPVAALWRVFKSRNPALLNTTVYYQFQYIMGGIFEIGIQNEVVSPDLERRWFNFAEALLRRIHVMEFHFSKELFTIDFIQSILCKKGEERCEPAEKDEIRKTDESERGPGEPGGGCKLQ